MIKYEKTLTVDDFCLEISRAADKADTIFQQLGLCWSRQWFRDQNGTEKTIESLVSGCLADILKNKSSQPTRETGFIKVEMWVDEDNHVNTEFYFNLN